MKPSRSSLKGRIKAKEKVFRRFAQSRIAFLEKLRNTPSIIFSDLLESALNSEIRLIHKVFRERCYEKMLKIYVHENGMK